MAEIKLELIKVNPKHNCPVDADAEPVKYRHLCAGECLQCGMKFQLTADQKTLDEILKAKEAEMTSHFEEQHRVNDVFHSKFLEASHKAALKSQARQILRDEAMYQLSLIQKKQDGIV